MSRARHVYRQKSASCGGMTTFSGGETDVTEGWRSVSRARHVGRGGQS